MSFIIIFPENTVPEKSPGGCLNRLKHPKQEIHCLGHMNAKAKQRFDTLQGCHL